MTSLMYAAESGQKDVAIILLEHGAAINAKNKNGQLLQIVIIVQYFNLFKTKYFLSLYLYFNSTLNLFIYVSKPSIHQFTYSSINIFFFK